MEECFNPFIKPNDFLKGGKSVTLYRPETLL